MKLTRTFFLIAISALFLFTSNGQVKKPKNIIVLIGDGMGVGQISTAMVANGGDLNLFKFDHIGFIKTFSASDLITDSGAAATAMACGVKTYNGAIGVDTNKVPVKSIMEIAKEKNKACGIVVTSSVTHATPAAYYSHQPSRTMDEEIALDLYNADLDIIIGGGLKYFKNRKDNQDLVEMFMTKKYKFVDDIGKIDKRSSRKALMLVANDYLENKKNRDDYLMHAWQRAFRTLIKDKEGFFLMLEASQIDWAGHAKNTPYLLGEMRDFDDVIGNIWEFLGSDNETLILVLADHETGGLSINGGSLKTKKVVNRWTTKNHTASLVPVFAHGPGAELFDGVYDNTEIFTKLKSLIE